MVLKNKKKFLRNLYNNTIINFVDKKIPQKGALSKNGFKVYKEINKQKNILRCNFFFIAYVIERFQELLQA